MHAGLIMLSSMTMHACPDDVLTTTKHHPRSYRRHHLMCEGDQNLHDACFTWFERDCYLLWLDALGTYVAAD
jgi:hypothetical protein